MPSIKARQPASLRRFHDNEPPDRTPGEMPQWLTVREFADLLGVTPQMVYNLTYDRKVTFYKFGSRTRFKRDDALAYIESRRCPAL